MDGTARQPLLPGAEIDKAILDEAAGWMVTLQSGTATGRDHAALARWRARSPAHEAAWQRAEALLGTLGEVPPRLGRDTLARLRPHRRQALGLGLLAMALPAAWLAWHVTPWRAWTADLRTATGERRSLELADGTQLVLNTATSVDLAFSATERRLHLRGGEILVTTGQDPSPTPRPFTVLTPQGRLRPLGTRFTVASLDGQDTRVGVLQGAVEVQPASALQTATVRAGEQLAFSATHLQSAQPLAAGAALWERGMLLARGMPLGELVAELSRYRRGVLRCDPANAALPVSGSFPLSDTDASLQLLQDTLPVRIERSTALWTTVRAR